MYFLLILLLLTSCSSNFDYVATVDRVVDRQLKILEKEEKLYVFGLGGGMADGINRISIAFVSYSRPDLAEARRLTVTAIERIRNAVNATESLHAYLNPYPFPISGMNVGILFLTKRHKFVTGESSEPGACCIADTTQAKGKLYYATYNPDRDLLEDYYAEPYEEALRIVMGEQEVPQEREPLFQEDDRIEPLPQGDIIFISSSPLLESPSG